MMAALAKYAWTETAWIRGPGMRIQVFDPQRSSDCDLASTAIGG